VTTNLWTVGQGLVTRRLVPKTAAMQAATQKRSSRTPPKPEQSADGPAKREAPAPQAGGGGQSRPKRVKKKKRARR
jgi:hypothetical protein